GHGAGAGAAATGAETGGGVPVVFVGVGAGERTRDVEIAAAEPPAVAFAGSPAVIAVTVRSSGYAGREVPLLLKRGEQVLVSRTLRLPPDGTELRESLEWTPPAPGAHALTLQVPLLDGEQIAENNRADLSFDAVRDRIRVLVVSGTPSWSYRFLRGALKGDPSLDVVSFIILRSASDAVDVPQQDLSLIPFPTQKIFMEELPNFDLLIFDNFASQPYLPSAYLEKVEEFVRGGGGFWMLGGPLSYQGGRYQLTPLAPLLPVSLPDAPAAGGGFRDVTVRPRLTAAGRAHPFFQGLVAQGGEPPPLQGYNVSGPAVRGAVVLAEVPVEGGPAQPLVVIGRHGKGRVLSVLTDSLWDWAFEEAGRGRGSRPYLAFVRQAVRWSIGDPQLEPARVEPERARVAPGEKVRARIRVLGEDFLPAASPDLSVTLKGPRGETRALAPTAEAPGVFVVEAPAPGEGTWEIAAEASARGKVYARAAAVVTAAWPLEEFRSPGLNRDALKALLAGRRGALLELGDAGDTAEALARVLRDLTGEGAAREREEGRALAESVPVFLLFLALLAGEWILRRRSGLD
ncbi:MAG TPA: glutamine amidotransferase, partial [bacterium]